MPKRTYLGDDVWETRRADGGSELEMAFTEAEYAALKADADKAGISVNDLVKQRLLAPADGAEDELPIWPVLRALAGDDGITVEELCAAIDAARPEGMTLARALRCYAVGHVLCEHADKQRAIASGEDELRRLMPDDPETQH